MRILIRKPLGYSQIGRKDQQEDAVWPLFTDVSENNPCIVLCDGVGGSEHGEIASQTTAKVIGEYLTKVIREKGTVTEDDVQDAVTLAYDELEGLDSARQENDSDPISMATTLTCVCLHKDGVLAAHMGDSRIYHVRPGQGLLYQSADHSLVNALLQAGELTVEEAKNFPRKNVITKAIQPYGTKRFKAEVQPLIDIKGGDYIFLCCDGVLEQLTNERLVEILSKNCSDKEKISLLEAESTGKTKDNYTAYLIPIDKVTGTSSIKHEDEVSSVNVESVSTPESSPNQSRFNSRENNESVRGSSQTEKAQASKRNLVIVVILFVICAFFIKKVLQGKESDRLRQFDDITLFVDRSVSPCEMHSADSASRGE